MSMTLSLRTISTGEQKRGDVQAEKLKALHDKVGLDVELAVCAQTARDVADQGSSAAQLS